MSTRDFNVSGFNRIHIKWAMEVEIVRGDVFGVSVTGTDTQIKNVNVAVEGDRLNLGYDLNLVSIIALPFNRMTAKITMPELRELDISGAAQGHVKGFSTGKDFSLYVSGASNLELTDMVVANMKWDLSGASRVHAQVKAEGDVDMRISGATQITLKGSARDMTVDASGASHIDMIDFPVRNARYRLSGASHGTVNLTGKLDAILDGASHLEFNGSPTMGETRVTGASTLKKK
jgi:hypothetical protein